MESFWTRNRTHVPCISRQILNRWTTRKALLCILFQSSGFASHVWLVAQSCPTLCDPMDCSPPGSSVHGDLPGKNTGVGCHALLQEIFPTQGSNPGLPHCRRILYQLSHKGSQRILEWVSLSLLQQIFPTQESNRGLLLCRRILYQLSYHLKQGGSLRTG